MVDPTTAGPDGVLLVAMAGHNAHRLTGADIATVPRNTPLAFAGDSLMDLVLGDLDGPVRLTPSGLPDLGPLRPTPAEIDAAWT